MADVHVNNATIRKRARSARLVRSASMLGALVMLLHAGAWAATIENTASVSYRLKGAAAAVSIQSNTVVTEVLPLPTPAKLDFLRFDPGSAEEDAVGIPLDGGQCRMGSGSFEPLPALVARDGQAIPPGTVETAVTDGYYAGEPIVVSISDPNRNGDPAVREYVDVDITTTTGDAETLRLLETGPDTGKFAGAVQSVPMPPDATQFDCMLSLEAFSEITARYSDSDFPLDAFAVAAAGYAQLPARKPVIRLEQTVSREFVERGDFLQYTLVLRNTHDAPARSARIIDTLPPGLRYSSGSLRVGEPFNPNVSPASDEPGAPGEARVSAVLQADPVIGADGRRLTIPVGDLAPGESVTATFIAEVGSGASGPTLVNYGIAHARGALASNLTDTVVRMRESLLTSRFTIIGRVMEGCDASQATGIAGVRLLLEDGTFVATDENGSYHFEGVRPGTHVVQIDTLTLPPGFEAAPCRQDTRFAGRGFSQFVEAQGGTLWRADFHLRPVAPPSGELGVRLRVRPEGERLHYSIDMDGGAVPVDRLRAMVVLPEGARYVPGSARVDGSVSPDPRLAANIATFALGAPGREWRHLLEFTVESGSCPAGGYSATAFLLADAADNPGQRTPPASLVIGCRSGPGPAAGDRVATTIHAATPQAAAALVEGEDDATLSNIVAGGGGDVDWFEGQSPGRDWLFPAMDYNPRTPSTRVVVKSMPGDRVALSVNGQAVSLLNFDGTRTNGAGTVAIGVWRGVDLMDGDNRLVAEITDGNGNAAARLERVVHYSSTVAKAEFVPEQSLLIADGIRSPVIAVRMLDRDGRRARKGMVGEFSLSPPYVTARQVRLQQGRQLAGQEGVKPTWTIQGDDGIAYIELAPTTSPGTVLLGFDFGARSGRTHQDIEAWLNPGTRDWIIVGFAKGTVGYEALSDNMEPLQPGEEGNGLDAKGRAALYAKGRVRGKWMLTLAYDSGKEKRAGLHSTIDPRQYYTLYGDGTAQGYDASSAEKLYLKLERDQFYALFGDFQTGLDRNELSRYQRTLNGAKVEYRGQVVEFNGFAARTSQTYARDELQGDGTSGLYRLSHAGILMNTERVRIETRDRYHSEQVIEARELLRHVDYDIDYDAGTLFFREPIASRDFAFNPNVIVVEYETRASAEEHLKAGGRVGVRLLGDRLEAGATYISDEDAGGRKQLAGIDAKFRLGEHDQFRAEVAASRTESAVQNESGSAWLVEWQHRGEQFDLLAYARRNGPAFGLGQQSGGQSGTFKAGAQGQWRLTERFSLQGEILRLENLDNGAVRDAAHVEVAYRGDQWDASVGAQIARDEALDGTVAESRQVTLGANRSFLDGRLALNARLDLGLGGKNDSVDYPTRFQLGASYEITKAFRVVAAQEFTDGEDRDTSTTRVGFETTPWTNASLTTTLNQSQISEYGPRTFALFGLAQKFLVGERWGLDVALDSSKAFKESGGVPLVVDPSRPIAPGGIRDGGALTEDFVALSGGVTYRADLWSWNARLEGRNGDGDRYGFTSAFLRQARDGVAMSASVRGFLQHNVDGSTGVLGDAQVSFAYRPVGSRWSMLEKLEYRFDELSPADQGGVDPATRLLDVGVRSRRLINNFVLNYAADSWGEEDTRGVLALDQRSQLSLYYGSKYVLESFGPDDYAGYTDILGAEWRFDINPRLDVGLRASVIHSWRQKNFAWAIGPSLGFSPFTNAWVSVGYNLKGFQDRDFEEAHHTAEGLYLVLRMKFDQETFGLQPEGGRAK